MSVMTFQDWAELLRDYGVEKISSGSIMFIMLFGETMFSRQNHRDVDAALNAVDSDTELLEFQRCLFISKSYTRWVSGRDHNTADIPWGDHDSSPYSERMHDRMDLEDLRDSMTDRNVSWFGHRIVAFIIGQDFCRHAQMYSYIPRLYACSNEHMHVHTT